MNELVCIGLSHRTAPLSVRERLALEQQRQLSLLTSFGASREALLVSTCNRVELYLTGAAAELSAAEARERLAALGGEESLAHLYEHRGEAALVHLFRVAASLDSMVLGEPQILGQVKDALEFAQANGTARRDLLRACQAAFASAKRVRTETGVGRAATSMASAAVQLAEKIFGELASRVVLVVGAGEMSELAARHLASAGVKQLIVTNRTFSRAEELAARVGGIAKPFEEVAQLLVSADVVVCSTASSRPIFTAQNVGAAVKHRRSRPLFMVDLAVPRDIATDVNSLPGVYAYDVDDIQKVVSENAAARAAEAAKAEALVAEEVARFVRDRALREGLPVLAQLRSHAEQIARIEVEKTLAQLGDSLSDKQKKSVEAMARAIVNKLLHQPTQRLRAVATNTAEQRLVGATAELFGLDSSEGEPVIDESLPLRSNAS